MRRDRTGLIRLTVLLDRSSIEVFPVDGGTVISDLFLALAAIGGSQLYVEGGVAHLRSLKARALRHILR